MGSVALEGFGSGGGTSLNFKVVDGLTQPGDPKENMIWVYTEGMTGWYFQSTQPENMQPGEVWISTGTSSPVAFNALKKNSVMVYPINAKQMGQDGVLADVTAKSWQNGKWVNWVTFLYDAGESSLDIIGSWKEVKGNEGIINWNADNIEFSHGATGRYAYIYTENTIDVTSYNTLFVEVSPITSEGSSGAFCAGIRSTPYTGADPLGAALSGWDASAQIKGSTTERQTLEIPISTLSGSYYFEITAGVVKCKVYSIYFE